MKRFVILGIIVVVLLLILSVAGALGQSRLASREAHESMGDALWSEAFFADYSFSSQGYAEVNESGNFPHGIDCNFNSGILETVTVSECQWVGPIKVYAPHHLNAYVNFKVSAVFDGSPVSETNTMNMWMYSSGCIDFYRNEHYILTICPKTY